jgi:hypothetical protein
MENPVCAHCGIYPYILPADKSPSCEDICAVCLAQPLDSEEVSEICDGAPSDERTLDLVDKSGCDLMRAARLLLTAGRPDWNKQAEVLILLEVALGKFEACDWDGLATYLEYARDAANRLK